MGFIWSLTQHQSGFIIKTSFVNLDPEIVPKRDDSLAKQITASSEDL